MENHLPLKFEFRFNDYLEVPSQGRSGGIVLLWLTSMVTVTHIRQTDQELHVMIK
ncbi:hypothetical protein HAX54_001399, partial [Datura stramonium]|nr:hypothetical protein [Datura stramonium]